MVPNERPGNRQLPALTWDICPIARQVWGRLRAGLVTSRRLGHFQHMTMPIDSDAPDPRRRPVFDLKWSLMWRVAVVALLCFLTSAAVALYRADQEAIAVNRNTGDTVGKHLELQLLRIDTALDLRERFPDADALLTDVMSAGQCVQVANPAGKIIRSNCVGYITGGRQAPPWFAALYKFILAPGISYERPIAHKGASFGKVVVSSDAVEVIARAWQDISRLLGLSAATIAAICVLVYFVIERALRPTKDVLSGLNRLAAGDLSCRLPPFQLVELQRISEVFNGLAGNLETTISERAGLARRLVDAQERERRHLARELHDELAQSLSAMSATAASIKLTAAADCPALVPEAQTLADTASTIMKVLRRTLRALRPHEIDELGLLASLQGLIADHTSRAGGSTRFRLNIEGDASALPATMPVHIFRIVQEGLTNAVKHAQAANVQVLLRVVSPIAAAGGHIELTIEDDGRGPSNEIKGESGFGFGLGLIGIRERVLALGGEMAVHSNPGKGMVLSVTLPTSGSMDQTLDTTPEITA